MERLRRLFTEATMESTSTSSGAVRGVAERALLGIPSEHATILYSELCRVQLARDGALKLESSPPFAVLSAIDFAREDVVARFHSAFIDDGWLIDRVADAIDLSPPQRRHKWKTQRANAARAARVHQQLSLGHRQWSGFMLESREANRRAYETVRAALRCSPNAAEWQTLIVETLERLRRKEPTFWKALQVAKCTTLEKRAVCHKLEQCREVAPGGLVTELIRSISEDIYAELQRTRRRRRRPTLVAWWRRVFRKPAAGERYDSSTPAPDSRPSA